MKIQIGAILDPPHGTRLLGVVDIERKQHRFVLAIAKGKGYSMCKAPPISMWFTQFLQISYLKMKPDKYETV